MISEKHGTHLPILLRIMEMTRGPVLELGMGQFSTPFLDMMCRNQKRLLASYDNDPKWHERNKRYEHEHHKVILVEDWAKMDIDSTHWSVVLIDHKPAPRRRDEAVRLKYKANYILLHDSEENVRTFYGYRRILPQFKYRYNYDKLIPNTLVLSNFVDLSNL